MKELATRVLGACYSCPTWFPNPKFTTAVTDEWIKVCISGMLVIWVKEVVRDNAYQIVYNGFLSIHTKCPDEKLSLEWLPPSESFIGTCEAVIHDMLTRIANRLDVKLESLIKELENTPDGDEFTTEWVRDLWRIKLGLDY